METKLVSSEELVDWFFAFSGKSCNETIAINVHDSHSSSENIQKERSQRAYSTSQTQKRTLEKW